MTCFSVRNFWETNSRPRGFFYVSAYFRRPGVGSKYGDPSHNALLRRGFRFCPLSDRWCPSRGYVELLRSDHPFRDFLDLCSRRSLYRDDNRRIVSSGDPIRRNPLTQHIQYGTKRTELEMATLGCIDLLGSMLGLALLHCPGDIRPGPAPVEGEGASKG